MNLPYRRKLNRFLFIVNEQIHVASNPSNSDNETADTTNVQINTLESVTDDSLLTTDTVRDDFVSSYEVLAGESI